MTLAVAEALNPNEPNRTLAGCRLIGTYPKVILKSTHGRVPLKHNVTKLYIAYAIKSLIRPEWGKTSVPMRSCLHRVTLCPVQTTNYPLLKHQRGLVWFIGVTRKRGDHGNAFGLWLLVCDQQAAEMLFLFCFRLHGATTSNWCRPV